MKLDPLGICFLISAFVCLSLALQWAVVTYPWSDPKVWGCILGFALLLSAFFADQLYKKEEYVIVARHRPRLQKLKDMTGQAFH